MTSRSRKPLALAVTLALVAGLVGVSAVRSPGVRAYPGTTVDLVGHGWGHGRGMGQWGALGYAVDHDWDWRRILAHYYSNTTEGPLPGGDGYPMSVQIMDRAGQDTIVTGQVRVDGHPTPLHQAVLARRRADGQFEVYSGSGCGGPWGAMRVQPGPVTMRPGPGSMLTICLSNGTRLVHGTVRADSIGAVQATVNDVAMGPYLEGVVPRESPASWAGLGGGKGMHALRAQAVAARSYAASEDRWPGVAKTCDTVSCQVYAGASQTVNGSTVSADARTNQAIADTAGIVRILDGRPARTEFSSSTGGYTAGGTFPAVPDEGDDVCLPEACNPNHEWTTKIPVGAIEARYGKGTLGEVAVVARNGLGDDGGRVSKIRLVFADGAVEVTGDQFRQAFGLKSNWFSVVNVASFPYHVVTRDGGVFSFGGATFHGSLPGIGIRTPAKDIAEGPGGYWILGEDGGVFSFDVPFHGSMGGRRLNSPVVGMEATTTRRGYWLVAGDGGIFSFGDAAFHGSTGNMRLNAPVVGMAAAPAGGYWLVATDGGVFTFGRAAFHGSTGNLRLNQPIFAMAPTPSGDGYWLVARDGGVFTFGDAQFFGSLPGRGVRETAVELLPDPAGGGYLIVTAQGRAHAFGTTSSGGGPADLGATTASVGAGRVPA